MSAALSTFPVSGVAVILPIHWRTQEDRWAATYL